MEKIIEKHPSVTICTGPCGTGKSVFIRASVRRFMQIGLFKKVLVIAPSEVMKNDYRFLPEKCRFIASDKKIVGDRLAQLIKEREEQPAREPMLLILDNMTWSIKFSSDPVKRLFACYRDLRLSILITSHYPLVLPPLVRENVTYVVIFHQTSMRACNALVENFCQEFKHWKQLKQFLDEKCVDYHFILVRTQEPIEKKYIRSKVQL